MDPVDAAAGARWPRGSLLGELGSAEQTALLALGTQRSHTRGEVLMREGEPGASVSVVLRGCVKVVGTAASGDPVLLAVRVAGDLVGELSLIDGLPRSATVVTASPTTTVRSIGHPEFAAHLATWPAVERAVHRGVSLKLRQATRFRSEAVGATVPVRLARVLTQLGARYGRPSPSGLLLDVHLTQTELADLVGAGEASIQRALGDLRDKGLVQTGYRQLLLRDVDGLSALVEEQR